MSLFKGVATYPCGSRSGDRQVFIESAVGVSNKSVLDLSAASMWGKVKPLRIQNKIIKNLTAAAVQNSKKSGTVFNK